ncbi:MAG: PQQ-binding-like beta-propeller repeat protein [Candidatus Lokiarchaeia archaeon]
MRRNLLILFPCVLLLAAFSIPVMLHSMSTSVSQNNMFSPVSKTVPEGGSIEWQEILNNAVGHSMVLTPDESYIFVGGANWTDPTNTTTWKPTLWKYTDSGSQVWNKTLNVQGYSSIAFKTLALSSDGSSVYAGGLIPNETSYYDVMVVKFNASNGSYMWNYTLSGPSIDNIYSLEVSPEGGIVYFAGSLSKSSTFLFNTSFYVGAINTTNGVLEWDYEIFLEGDYNYGYARDLALSSSGEVLYAAGYHRAYDSSNITTFVALNTTTRSQLWNITATRICCIDISSDGNSIYSISPVYANYQLLTINTSNGNTMENLSISNLINPQALSLSFNESKLYVLTRDLQALGQNLVALMVELDFLGTITSVLLAPNNQMWPYSLASSNDNVSVYVVASMEPVWSDIYSMFLMKGQAGPIPLPTTSFLPLFYVIYSQNQSLSTPGNNVIIGVGMAIALVLVGFLISKMLRGGF